MTSGTCIHKLQVTSALFHLHVEPWPLRSGDFSFLSVSSSEVCTSRDHFLLSLDFHELWRSVMSAHLFTEGKPQWATLVLE